MKNPEFLWGVATSAHQIEGHNSASDWWAWEKAGNIEGGALSGPATNHWYSRREDLERIQSLGCNSYRFSIEWAKLEPKQGVWDESAFTWYDELLNECNELGIIPMATLHHFTLPEWLAEQGGLTHPQFALFFQNYTTKVAERWGARVSYWCTLNEPMVLTVGAYLGSFMPPARFSPPEFSTATRNLFLAHCLAYKVLKQYSPESLVGVAHNMIAFLPDRRWHPLERLGAKLLSRFYNRSWLEALTGGRQNFSLPFVIPNPPSVPEAFGKCQVDFIGLNYYTKAYVQWWPRDNSQGSTAKLPLGLAFARRTELQSDLGWAVYSTGFAESLKFVQRYNLPILVTENGIADRDDSRRPQYLFEHLKVLAEARETGADIRGYYHWSLLDNFEWIKGFHPRFGLFSVDYDSFAREERASARLYRRLIRACGQGLPRSAALLREWLDFTKK